MFLVNFNLEKRFHPRNKLVYPGPKTSKFEIWKFMELKASDNIW